ncbi:MAG TPA: cation:proton antiporter subunit C [Opitutales bacterium]|nr:cation:proton antiporter subunit C [Opitutales bacterium]
MGEIIHDYYAYWMIVVILIIGLYGMLMKRNLVKKLIGMILFQTGVILFFVTAAFKWGGSVPVVNADSPPAEAANYLNPLPHTLMLTAIVVGVAITGVAFAMLIMIYRNFETLDEPELLERME